MSVSCECHVFRSNDSQLSREFSYFRQLQEVSDSVAETTHEGLTLHEALDACKKEIDQTSVEMTSKKNHMKYLESLAAADEEDDSEQCIICTDSYKSGWIFDWYVKLSSIS
jgi:E3 ubiquitin-protein ligase SHPRH